jgi:hypothetical protein
MIASTQLKALLANASLSGALAGRITRISLSITLIAFGLSTHVPARAAETGKTTQFFRAQALQNIAAGRDEEALDSYKAAIKAARTQYGQDSTYLSELYFEMGNLARSNGQSEIAKNCYKSAVTYRPNDIPARLQLADLERNTKNIREAFEDSKAAFQLNQNSPIARKGLMLCLQQCGRPAEAAQVAATLHRTSKGSKMPTNLSRVPENASASNQNVKPTASDTTTGTTTTSASAPSPANASGPIVTAAVSSPNPLHWAPNLKKKIDEAAAKKTKDAHAAEAAKKKQEEDQKAESDKRAKDQHHKEELERKSKQKSKKEETQKKKDESAKKSSKTKPAFVEPEVNSASLKTTAKTIPATKGDDKSTAKSEKSEKSDKGDKSEKPDKPTTKSHLGVGAVTEKTEKPAEEKHESVSENEPAKVKNPQADRAPAMSYPTQQSVPIAVPVVEKRGKPPHLGRGGLVPPPPATPFFPSYPPPPGLMQAPAPVVAPHPPKPKPKAVVKETPKDTSSDEASPSPKGGSDDPDFLIDWGGGAKKKHGK